MSNTGFTDPFDDFGNIKQLMNKVKQLISAVYEGDEKFEKFRDKVCADMDRIKENFKKTKAIKNERIKTLEEELSGVNDRYKELEETHTKLEDSFDDLKDKYDHLKIGLDESKEEYSQLGDQYDSLRAEKLELDGKYEKSVDDLAGLKLENRGLERELKNLNQDLVALQRKFSDLTDVIAQYDVESDRVNESANEALKLFRGKRDEGDYSSRLNKLEAESFNL